MSSKKLSRKHRNYLYSKKNIDKLKQICRKPTRKLTKRAKQISPELGYLIGVILGDGYLSRRYISLHVKDRDFAKYFSAQFKKWCDISPPTYKYENTNYYEVKIGFTEACTFLKTLISNLSWINRSSAEVKRMLLKGLWDSEGSIDDSFIDFCNTSYKIALLYKNLCQGFGIKTTFHKYDKIYHVRVFTREHKTKFFNEIGITITRKREKLLKILSKKPIYKKWSDMERTYVFNNYNNYTDKNLASILNRSCNSIARFRRDNKLRK